MARKNAGTRSAEAWSLARRQHGVVSRRQLLALGFSPAAIEHRIKRGRLHPVGHGIYAVGRPQLTREGDWMAAVLACGGGVTPGRGAAAVLGHGTDAALDRSGAVLSHHSAAALWGIGFEVSGRIDVTLLRPGRVRRPGIRTRSRPSLPASDITEHRGIPVTTAVRTLIDVAGELASNRLERAVNEADKHDLVDPDRLRLALERYPGVPGVRPLRGLLDKHTFRLSDEELERRFRPIAAASGLPVPLTKAWVSGFEVDFFWPGIGLVVETDGWRYHRTPAAQTRDARRFQMHTAAGLTPLRFSHWQVKHEPAYVRRILEHTLAHLRRRGLGAGDGEEERVSYPKRGSGNEGEPSVP
jgi:hypothetical protein